MDRAKIANDCYEAGYNCAQAVACAFVDVVGLPVEQLAGLLGTFGGGFRTGEICGVISGAAVVLGARWPHSAAEDAGAKALAGEKIRAFQEKFLSRFPAVDCRALKNLDAAAERSPAAQRLGVEKTCGVYIVSAVELLEEMLGA